MGTVVALWNLEAEISKISHDSVGVAIFCARIAAKFAELWAR